MLTFYIRALYNQIPNVYKRLGNDYRSFFSFLVKSDNWNKSEILEYRYSRYEKFKKKYINEIILNEIILNEDELNNTIISKIFVSKKNLQDDPNRYLLNKSDKYFECMTGGSTGNPTKFYLSKKGVRKNEAFLDFILDKEGISRFTMPKKVVFRGIVLPEGKDHLKVFNTLYLSSFSLSEEKLIRYIKLIQDFEPTLIHAYPSSINSLVNTAITYNKSINFPSVKHILISSEICNIHQKRTIKTIFNEAKIIDFYSNSEQTVFGYQIDFEDGIFPFQYGNIVTDENNIILSTSFMDKNNILFNYKTDDVVSGFYIDENNNFRYKSIEGRKQDFLYGEDLSKISLATLNMHEIFFNGIISFQFEQKIKGKVTVNLVVNDTIDIDKNVIELYFKNKLKAFDVLFSYKKEIERTKSGKELLIISDVKEIL